MIDDYAASVSHESPAAAEDTRRIVGYAVAGVGVTLADQGSAGGGPPIDHSVLGVVGADRDGARVAWCIVGELGGEGATGEADVPARSWVGGVSMRTITGDTGPTAMSAGRSGSGWPGRGSQTNGRGPSLMVPTRQARSGVTWSGATKQPPTMPVLVATSSAALCPCRS